MLCDKVSTKAPEGTSPNSCLASMTNYVEFRVGIIGRAQTPVALNPSNRKSHGKQVENEMKLDILGQKIQKWVGCQINGSFWVLNRVWPCCITIKGTPIRRGTGICFFEKKNCFLL